MAQASAENLEQTAPVEKERVVSVPRSKQLANTPEPLLPKRKGTELGGDPLRRRRPRICSD